MLNAVRSHTAALQAFQQRHRMETALDAERAERLNEIRRSHPGAKIVGFAQYAETVSALFRRVSGAAGVAMLTARGGLVAGGKLTRSEALARFAPFATNAPSPPAAERIDLLLATDLLSEGVNLQDAEVVVHLDIPWTAARMEQRVGRVARMGSTHQCVHVYSLQPPASAAALLRSEVLVQRKWVAAKRVVGSNAESPFASRGDNQQEDCGVDSVPAKTERLRGILERWRRRGIDSNSGDVCVASVRAARTGFVAAVTAENRALLLACISDRVSADLDSQIAVCLLSEGPEVNTDADVCEAAVTKIHSWFEHDLAAATAGVGGSHSRARMRILTRIDCTIQNAPPHLRASRSRIAARARNCATIQHGVAFEAELESLAHSALPDHEWLEAVVGLETRRRSRRGVENHTPAFAINAVLLLRTADEAFLDSFDLRRRAVEDLLDLPDLLRSSR
jgi:hypothetical protein